MPEDQYAFGHCGRAPVASGHLPSEVPRGSSLSSSPYQPVKVDPEAQDATGEQPARHIPPSSPQWPEKVEFEVEEATNQTAGISVPAGHVEDATEATLDAYIPAGVLSKSSFTTVYPASEVALLEQNQWIRAQSVDNSDNVQIFVLPDAERLSGPRSDRKSKATSALKLVMSKIDSSPEAWISLKNAHGDQPLSIPINGEEDESLWYIFNTLRDPDPSLHDIKDIHTQEAMEDLLEGSVLGLETSLHRYQRRSAAVMVQREAQPALVLDPRLQAWKGPTGLEFYYDKVEGSILREKIMYPEACGGILAESMGCGKTLISLAVILATRGHLPKTPVEYQTLTNRVRNKTGTLMDMAATTAGRFSLPWKQFFQRQESEGKFYNNCVKACEADRTSYYIPPLAKHQSRHSSPYVRPAKQIRLCSGTMVIVPLNLVDHWESEIATHTRGLEVLVLREPSDKTPSMDELLKYDIVLFSKNRFGQESHSRNKNKPNSPIFDLHWLRVIVDEGHNVAGRGTVLVSLLQELYVERRWIISGTPARRMYGVELNRASQQTNTSDTESSSSALTADVLERGKKTGNAIEEEINDVNGLGHMVAGFFDLKPWSNKRDDWAKYTRLKDEDGVRRKASSLRATLQSLIVRHRLDVVREEITLPPMFNKVVYLKPTFYDRLSINIFLFSLAVNAITSERTGPDYMFDPKNKKDLNVLIGNLRQAGFWWVGSGDDVQITVNIAREYLDKNQEKMPVADLEQLSHGIQIAQKALGCSAWNEFNNLRELGVFVRGFPAHARSLWALNPTDTGHEPLLMGISQASKAQEFVKNHLRSYDPAEGLAGYGIKIRRELANPDHKLAHSGAPESANPQAQPVTPNTKSKKKKPAKHTFNKKIIRTLPDDSPLKQTLLEGVASAKLRYLLEKVLEFQKTEKIIIFYEDDNTAIWVAEGLELIAANFRIYANSQSLNSKLRDEYLNLFRESEDIRVLLMDLKQASHGLHIAQASRVFIINPIWEPNIESQAIGRAHRIGQTRPVHVETLVLEGTIEKAMLHRRKAMSEAEIQQTKSMTDDSTMSDIIRNAPFLPMFDEASTAMASLARPIGFFDRHSLPIPDSEAVSSIPEKRDSVRNAFKEILKRRQLPVSSDADSDSDSAAVEEWPRVKRSRLGFAENVQVMSDGPVDMAAGSLRSPESDLASSAGIPVSQQLGLSSVDRAQPVCRSIPPLESVESAPTLPSTSNGEDNDGDEKWVSIFGP
ncbi:SNF2-related protein [Penicillium paradoxum]|uniref:SNF2-related protein n=1 Tax=Penicillium paradoxum TaxID=176176 RepID=UPI00254985AB|nr:SNF2-related protein [Penicillium paradoxum]KAJ5779320.1 SNF2-related protein [Penicillium paradoxum]